MSLCATHRKTLAMTGRACFIFGIPLIALADPPPGYYDSVDATNSTTLRTTLHQVIDGHLRFPYTSGATDTWDILNLADEDPNNADNILDVYKNASYAKVGNGTGPYSPEHTWSKSYGFPDNSGDDDNYPFSDCRANQTGQKQ